jgi:hypothetical protein
MNTNNVFNMNGSNSVEWIQHTNTRINTIASKTFWALATFDLRILHK